MLIVPIINIILNKKNIKYLDVILYGLFFLIIINCNNISKIMYRIPALEYYAHYLKSPNNIEISIWYFVKTLPIIIPYFVIRKEIDEDNDLKLIFSLTVIGCLLNLLAFFTIEFGERIAYYFIVYQIILVSAYTKKEAELELKRIKLTSKQYLIACNVIFTIFYISYWYHDYIYKNMNETFPYKSIFKINDKI